MLLQRYLPRAEFSSYEDFKQNYKVNVPADFNFAFDIVDEWARLEPLKKALVWCDDHGGEEEFTFADISRLSNQAANYFLSLGIKRGDTVLFILRRRWEFWICAAACMKIGAVFIPASMQLTRKDISYRVKKAEVKTIITISDEAVISQIDPEEVERVITVGFKREGLPFFNEEIKSFPEAFERAVFNKSTDTMFLYFTSGTTGFPKMVRHNYTHPLGHIVTAKYWQRVQDGRLHMSVAESGWAKFGWGKIYGQWICGAVIFAYDMDKFVAVKLLEKLEKYKVATFCAPPTILRFMLLEDLARFDLSSVENCCIAGEPLNPEVYNQWQNITGLKLCEGFGQTESSVIIANFPWFAPKPGSMGKPSPLYEIDLIDENGNPCVVGEEGQIIVRGIKNKIPGLFTGYYKDDALTERVMGGDYYDTGDVAWRDNDGYYWFVGRNDDVIKCSGYRIGPFEVESAIVEHPAVIECAVTAAPDATRGQVVKATVVLKNGFEPSDSLKKEIQEHVKKVTAPYKYPRIVEFVNELPKTVSGKIKRAEIRAEN